MDSTNSTPPVVFASPTGVTSFGGGGYGGCGGDVEYRGAERTADRLCRIEASVLSQGAATREQALMTENQNLRFANLSNQIMANSNANTAALQSSLASIAAAIGRLPLT